MHYATHSQEDTDAFGRALAGALASGDCVLLLGDLGAGKSVLSRGIGHGLGVKSAMPSPTFTIMQPYKGTEHAFYHFDLYRLEDEDEFYAAGLDEWIGGQGIAAVEWPDQIGLSPTPRIELRISRGEGESVRQICVRAYGIGDREQAIHSAIAEWRVNP